MLKQINIQKKKSDITVKNFWKYTSCVLAAILFFAIIALFFLIKKTNNSYDKISDFKIRYPFLSVIRGLVEKQHFIGTLEPLRKDLRTLSDEYGNEKISIYVEYLNTGANISINNDLRMWPASLAKLPLAMAVVKKVERGEWMWDSELVLLEQDRDQKSGNEYNHAIGTRYTVKDLVERMLEDSDNTAFNIFLRNMENSDIEDLIRVLGLEDLFSDEGKITAKEYSRIFRALYVANYLNEDNSQLLLYFLGQASFKDFLSKGIPESVIFAHKYGENIEENVYLDSGIIYIPDRPVLITVAIEGKEDTTASKSKAQELMQKISQLTYNYVSQK